MVFAWSDISFYFGPAFLSFTLPALIIAFLGWHFGRLIAMRRLSTRRAFELAAGITLVPLVSWANSLLLAEQMSGEPYGVPIVAGTVAIGWCLAIFAGLVSWAINLDDFWASRRSERTARTESENG